MIKKRILLTLVFMGIFALAYQLGSYTDISTTDAKLMVDEFKKQITGYGAIEIFEHNTMVALPMVIPGAGIVWGAIIAGTTGAMFKSISLIIPQTDNFPALVLLVLTPFGIMELIAYGIGMSRSAIIINAIRKKKLRHEIRPTIYDACIMVAILLVAGFVEAGMIQMVGKAL